jgi:VCBS repeat-containing protein
MAIKNQTLSTSLVPPTALKSAVNFSGLNTKPYSFTLKDFNLTSKIPVKNYQIKLSDIDYKGDGYFIYNNQRLDKSSNITIKLSTLSKLNFVPGSDAATKSFEDTSNYVSFKFSLSSNKGLSFGNTEDFSLNVTGINKAFIKNDPNSGFERILYKSDFSTSSLFNPAVNKIQLTSYPRGALKFLDSKGVWINFGGKGSPKTLTFDDINNGKLKLINASSAEIKFNLLAGSKIIDKGKLILSVGDSKAVISGESNVISNDDGSASEKLSINDKDPYDKPSFKEDIIQGKYGVFKLAVNGSWSYDVNNESINFKNLLLGQSAEEKVSVYSADSKSMMELSITVKGQSLMPPPVDDQNDGS